MNDAEDREAPGGWRPLCTNCAYPASHVYTTYTSRSNIRLGVCVSVFLAFFSF